MRIGLDIDGAWAAGFFDGEGSIGCYYREDRPSWRLACGITQKDRRVLERFRKIVGVGSVGGPYKGCGYYWRCTTLADVEQVFDILRPYLDTIKTEQFERALDKYRTTPHRRVHAHRAGH